MFNPYTGTPRHPSDIASDPEGLLILEPWNLQILTSHNNVRKGNQWSTE